MMTRLFFQDWVYHCVVLPRFRFSFQKKCIFLDLQEHLLGAPLVGDKTDAEGPVRLVGLPVPRWQYRTYYIILVVSILCYDTMDGGPIRQVVVLTSERFCNH